MGWHSAVYIFDATIEAAVKLEMDTANHFGLKLYMTYGEAPTQRLIDFAKVVRDELEGGDWDSQQESGYWEWLAPYLWPKQWQQHLADLEEFGDD